MEALNTIDLDELQQLIGVLRDGGVHRFERGPDGSVIIEFAQAAPAESAPQPEIKQPLSSMGSDHVGETLQPKHPGYHALFGGQLPKFPAPKE